MIQRRNTTATGRKTGLRAVAPVGGYKDNLFILETRKSLPTADFNNLMHVFAQVGWIERVYPVGTPQRIKKAA